MLCAIDEVWVEDAHRLLTLLCFASRPLLVEEAIDGLAVNIGAAACLDRNRRLSDFSDLLSICPGMIEVVDSSKGLTEISQIDDSLDCKTVRIAHYSVQEYLQSRRIQDHTAKRFALRSESAHRDIAHICVTYMTDPDMLSELPRELSIRKLKLTPNGEKEARLPQIGSKNMKRFLKQYPLLHYAAKEWQRHYNKANTFEGTLDDKILEMFSKRKSCRLWLFLEYGNQSSSNWLTGALLSTGKAVSPLYFSSWLGYVPLVQRLLSKTAKASTKPMIINQPLTEVCGTPLRAAAASGHEAVISLLIEAGADANVRGRIYGSALDAAACQGNPKVVKQLIDAGADANLVDDANLPLISATWHKHEDAMKVLLAGGANVDTVTVHRGPAIVEAMDVHFARGVRILMRAGANVNVARHDGLTVLMLACWQGKPTTVKMLLEAGAEVNSFSRWHGTALMAATLGGHGNIVEMLICAGADPNLHTHANSTVLDEALINGDRTSILALLKVDARASHPALLSEHLYHASANGDEGLVRLLLDSNANPNHNVASRCGARINTGTAFVRAAVNGHETIARVLLDAGADIDAPAGSSGETALIVAADRGHTAIVRMLLERGADVHARSRMYGTARTAAVRRGHWDVAGLLRGAGAAYG